MERRYFTKTIRSPYGWKDEPKLVTRYIVTEKEWKNTELLCQRVLAKNKECKFANSILTYHKPYVKSYETEPDMPENSHSFILYEDEARLFEEVCLGLFLNIYD